MVLEGTILNPFLCPHAGGRTLIQVLVSTRLAVRPLGGHMLDGKAMLFARSIMEACRVESWLAVAGCTVLIELAEDGTCSRVLDSEGVERLDWAAFKS